MSVYPIEYFKNFSLNNNNITLPLDIQNIISELTELVSAPEYNKSPEFSLDKYKKKKRNDSHYIDNISFTRTVINKKEGINKEIDNSRILLNKLTKTNLSSITESIKEQLDIIIINYSDEDCINYANSLFSIFINNSMFTSLYALLLKEINTYSFINTTLNNKVNTFLDYYKEIHSKDLIINLTIDEISKQNKLLDQHKSCALLYSYLLINDIIDKSIILNYINQLLNIFFELTNIADKKIYVEEICEIIFIFVKYCKDILKKEEEWEEIENNINYIANMKYNQRLSITNKVIFKFMDLKDEIN